MVNTLIQVETSILRSNLSLSTKIGDSNSSDCFSLNRFRMYRYSVYSTVQYFTAPFLIIDMRYIEFL